MSNTITIELCTEDRARLDRLAEALERKTCDKCVATALEIMGQSKPAELDPVQQKAAEVLARAEARAEVPKNATGEAEAPTLPTTPPEEEKPEVEESTPPATEKIVQADIRGLYVQLSSKGKKKEAQAIILPYATSITGIPDDKCAEIYEKLIALKREVLNG